MLILVLLIDVLFLFLLAAILVIVAVLYLLMQEQGFPVIIAPFAGSAGKGGYFLLSMSFCPVFLVGRECLRPLFEQRLN